MDRRCSNDPQIQARWRQLLVEHASSGVSLAAFARSRGVSRESLYKWRRWFRHQEEGLLLPAPAAPSEVDVSSEFVQLRVEEPASTMRRDRMTVELPCGTWLHLEPGFEASAVGQLLTLLRST